MAAEIWDLYDGCGEKTGRTLVRGEAIPTGFYHIGVHIWPMHGRGELLIQRRSMSVQWKPGIWAATGGSAVSGEEPLAAARRELREELGYAASEEEMRFVARLRRSNSYCYVGENRPDGKRLFSAKRRGERRSLVLAPAADANGRRGQHV